MSCMSVMTRPRPTAGSAGRPDRSRRRLAGAVLLTGTVLAATALGGVLAYRSTLPAVPPASLHVAGVTYAVTHVEQVAGLSDADLSGMSHGIQGLVGDDQALVRVTLEVTADVSTVYDPSTLVVDEGRGGAPLSPVGGSLAPGGLRGGGRIEGALGFVVQRAGQHLTLRAPGVPGGVDLLTVDTAPPGAGTHSHSTAPDPGAAQSPGGSDGSDPFSLDPVPGDPGTDPSGATTTPGS